MGKRGPKAKGEYQGKTAVLSTRITPELRARLQAAVKASGHTLSREVEHRLRRSFHEADRAEEGFGSLRTKRLMQMIALGVEWSFNPEDPTADWLSDPAAFEMAVRTANEIFEFLRPPGQAPELNDAFAQLQPMNTAAQMWKTIQDADPSLPLAASGRRHLANVIRADLGDAVDRTEIFEGTAADLRRFAAEIDAGKKPKRKRKP